MSTTPTTPQWMQDAVREIHPWEVAAEGAGSLDDMQSGYDENEENLQEDQRILAIIAKHAPSPVVQPTDELREKYRIAFDALCKINLAKNQASAEIAGAALQKCIDVPEAEESALAPHLSQREPGDSELRGRLVSAGDLTLVEDGEQIQETGVFVKCTREALCNLKGKLIYSEVEIRKSAMRGEGKP